MSDIDRVWLAPHHPSVGWELLHNARHLPPDKAAGLLLEHMPRTDQAASLAQRLDCIGIALGTLNPSFSARENARSLWRSTLPVMLVSPHPQGNAPIARELAEQVGYLVYGSAEGSSSHRRVRDFADEFKRAFAGV